MSDNTSILEFQEDIADAEAPKALPANEYPAEIIAAEIGTSQSSGKRNVKVTWLIKPEDFPADYEDADQFADGKQIIQYVGAEPDKSSRYRLRRFIESVGAKTGKKLDVNDWIGCTAMIEVVPDEWEGVQRDRITGVKAA